VDLVDRIERARFLGPEFLLWLWFKADTQDMELAVRGFPSVIVALESQITLLDPLSDIERIAVKSQAPASRVEVREALRQGKVPIKATLRLTADDTEYVFSFDAAAFSFSAVKLPAVTAESEDDTFSERLYLIERLDDLVQALYGAFLAERLLPAWKKEVAPAMRAWVTSG
jgi:hypothetical protein